MAIIGTFRGLVSDGTLPPSAKADIAAAITTTGSTIRAALDTAGLGQGQGQTASGARTLADAFRPPEAPDYPTVTVHTAGDSPLIAAGGTLVREARYTDAGGFSSMSKTDPAFRFDGTPEMRRVSANPDNYVGPLNLPGDSSLSVYTPVIETVTAAANTELEFVFRAVSTALTFRVYVDGRPLTVAASRVTGLTAGGAYLVRLAFPTARARSVKITWTDNSGFGGVYVPTGQALKRPTKPLGMRVAVIGDSYEGGSGATPGGGTRLDTGGVLAAHILGAGSIWNFGIGGTGYLATDNEFIDRVAATIACAPDLVIVSGTINDGTADTPELRAAVTDVVTQLKAAIPEVYVTGPSRSTQYAPNNTAVRESAVAAGAVYLDPLEPALWLSPSMIGTDNAHPTWEGHQVRGQKIAEGILPHRLGKIPAPASLTLAAAPPVEPPPTPTVGIAAADTFTRADSPTLGATETGAFAWSTADPGWTISTNQLAYSSTTITSNVLVNAGGGNTRHIVRGTFASPAGVAGALLANFNAAKSAGYSLNRGSNNAYTLRAYLGGTSFVDLATVTGVTAAAGDTGEIEFLADGTIVARVNGVATAPVTNSSSRGGYHGFWGYANHNTRYDDFAVEFLA